MPEPVPTLPADHAFVLQLQGSQGCPGTCRAGRVEHLATGQAARFTTPAELWDFVNEVLTAVAERREQDLRKDSLDRWPRS